MRYVEFESTVKGGLPCIVRARMHPPEPDVGIFDWQAEPEICWPNGKPMNIEIPQKDVQRILEECHETEGVL